MNDSLICFQIVSQKMQHKKILPGYPTNALFQNKYFWAFSWSVGRITLSYLPNTSCSKLQTGIQALRQSGTN